MNFFKPARVIVVISLVLLFSTICLASGEQEAAEAPKEAKSDLATGLLAIGAALAVGLCAIATGIAQSRIGAAGCGTLAEKPEVSGTIILLVAIPETMVILGFVVAVVMLFT